MGIHLGREGCVCVCVVFMSGGRKKRERGSSECPTPVSDVFLLFSYVAFIMIQLQEGRRMSIVGTENVNS